VSGGAPVENWFWCIWGSPHFVTPGSAPGYSCCTPKCRWSDTSICLAGASVLELCFSSRSCQTREDSITSCLNDASADTHTKPQRDRSTDRQTDGQTCIMTPKHDWHIISSIASGQSGFVRRLPKPIVCCVSIENNSAVVKSYTYQSHNVVYTMSQKDFRR